LTAVKLTLNLIWLVYIRFILGLHIRPIPGLAPDGWAGER
jgi:hypothetical protein